LVAATTRACVRRVAFEPSRSNSPVCSTRSSFACPIADRLPSSSRKMVPPSAASKRPVRALAPVKAPASVPNNSASISVSGSAPRLTLT